MHTLAFIALLAALAAPPTRAPSTDEQRLYDEGSARAAGGRRARRREGVEERLRGRPATRRSSINIGEAQEKAGAPAEAADSYRRYLREVPDAADVWHPTSNSGWLGWRPPGRRHRSKAPAEPVGELGAGQNAAPALGPKPGFSPDARHIDTEQPSGKPQADDWGLEPLQHDRHDLVGRGGAAARHRRRSTRRPRHPTPTT